MTDLFKSKENEFYIQLKEERFYIPGEDISGDVILDLQKATKTNNIKVTLEGTVTIGGRTLVLFTTSLLVAESLDGQKSHYLEAHTHRFPFRITIPSPKTHNIPSTLEIPNFLKVAYKLTAIYNKAFTLEKFCPTTSVPVNILEDINVEKVEFSGERKIEREILLTNEKERKVKVIAIVQKRAAVKGDTIPISIRIEHIGVMVRDKAITAQLLRSVYYGRNKSEIVGPKVLREVTSDIIITGPIDFTGTFNLKLPIPSNICPTVAESGDSFKIEYFLRIRVNLNEENPLHKESDNDIAIFNAPFIIGTYPKLAFNIDDDEEEEQTQELKEEINTTEMDQVVEKMKYIELESPAATNEDTVDNKETNASNQLDNCVITNPQKITSDNSTLPINNNMQHDGPSLHSVIPPNSPSMPSLIQRQSSVASSLHRTDTTSSIHSIHTDTFTNNNNGPGTSINNDVHRLGRQESVRWVLNQEKPAEPIPTTIPSPQHIPSTIHYNIENHHSFAMPTPVMNNTLPCPNNNDASYITPQHDSYLSYPSPPPLPIPQQQYSIPTAHNNYPPQYHHHNGSYYNTAGSSGYPLPQPESPYPPPPLTNESGYVSMPSHFNYQPSYPYYNNY